MRLYYISIIALSTSLYGMELSRSLIKPAALHLYHYNQGHFETAQNYSAQDTFRKPIPSYNIDPVLRTMDKEQLQMFLKDGYIKVHELTDESGESEYKLVAHSRLRGGGPIAGAVGYWGTKAVAFGVVMSAANYIINKITRPGHRRMCGHFLRRGGKGLIYINNARQGLVTDATEIIINSHNLQPHAVEGTAAFITSAGGGVGAATAIESAALWVGGVLTAVPWLP